MKVMNPTFLSDGIHITQEIRNLSVDDMCIVRVKKITFSPSKSKQEDAERMEMEPNYYLDSWAITPKNQHCEF